MKKAIIIFPILAFAGVFIAKISNLFLHYDEETNRLINSLMFCFIGVWYIADSLKQSKTAFKILFLVCGGYLILMNFIETNPFLKILGILSIIIPLIVIRRNRKRKQREELIEQ